MPLPTYRPVMATGAGPATIIFAPDGTEIVKLSGYIPAPRMAFLLQAIIDDPSPGPSVLAPGTNNPLRRQLICLQLSASIFVEIIWLSMTKNMAAGGKCINLFTPTACSLPLRMPRRGIARLKKWLDRRLMRPLSLFDPIWGGVYQYSDQRDWKSPHYEKIMSYQSDYMRQYAKAYALWGDPKYLQAAKDIDRYLRDYLTSPDGTFYTSQDADLNQQVDGQRILCTGRDGARKIRNASHRQEYLYAGKCLGH